ncbi:hypothetical protein [Streptomyces sp. NPDC053427]|uniref:hypothetical protein n=1 Tax=Streptomyces sp. NPDC053427 TaxID=3365701 RepID=UPI0037D7BD4C
MSFAVEPADLDGYAKLLFRASEDAGAGIDYMQKNCKLEAAAGDIWQLIFTPHSEHMHDAKKCLEAFQRVLDASSDELKKSAKYYLSTDEEQARKVDATYPQSKPHRSGDAKAAKGPSSSFADKADASSRLKAPGGEDSYVADWLAEAGQHPGEKIAGTLLDLASPSAMVLEFIKIMTGWDPLGDFLSWIAGDWESYLECAEVWGCLADLCGEISQNVKAGNIELDATWQGNSADSAYVYFDEAGGKLLELQETFTSLQDNYSRISGAVYAFAEFLKGLIVQVLDLGLNALLKKIAGDAALAAGPLGATVAAPLYAMVAADILRITKKWGDAMQMVDKVMKVVSAGAGVIEGTLAGTVKSVSDFPVPGKGYDNRAA